MTLAMGAMAEYLTHAINPSRTGSFIALCICIPLGALLYLGAALLLRAPEAHYIVTRLRGRLRT